MAIGVVSFSFSWWLTGGPGAQLSDECWLALPHLVSNSSDLQLTPSLQLSDPQLSDFLFSPNYIIVQSPNQYLEWPVWSSSSGNNCHAVHRSLSSGASVYECTMGILPCPILLAKSTYAISPHKCHRNVSLPSGASLWNGIFGRIEGQYITYASKKSSGYPNKISSSLNRHIRREVNEIQSLHRIR